MRSTRRDFLQGLSFAALAPALGRSWAQERPALPIPPLVDVRPGTPVTLTARVGETEFFPGKTSPTAGYNRDLLGPTLRVRSGDEVTLVVRNELPETTTVHWHGLLIPAAVDGGPHNTIAPGQSWKAVLPVQQPASTCWYHPHPHGRTGLQVYGGLAGMLLVTDREEQALGLPARYGVDDLPLVLQDRVFDREQHLVYPRGPMALMHGVLGSVMLVNGVREPRAAVPAGLVRLRLLNGSNARVYELAFEDQRSFHWIGTDGGLLRAPVPLQRLPLAPGQRAELLVDFSDGHAAVLLNRTSEGAQPLLHFAPAGERQPPHPLPARLASWQSPDPKGATQHRRLTLTMGNDGMGSMPGMHGMPMPHGFDGRPFDMDRIDQRVKLGAVEIWEVSALPGMMMDQAHPFHMHGVHFEVLRRDGRAPGPLDQGRRDTVLVHEPVDLLVHFTRPGPTVPFMYHCHILEHEDGGMMGQFTVT
ncbi:MAG TPA: multicopper oxidase domain-containing protein [Ramlibacter sp.]|uniref:multicopper oxidase family protein n=1 Tax=Ramlibacter sp. TaxID=1917967 RepID=UPI002D7E4B13|nr:multicopper oxidase domain-containing protein [Ramlibacter sp.]HET8747323.1 multicopper oxidase domain-containing protein [Ramlibacter sp.]